MQRFSASPRECIASVWRHKALIWNLTKREVVGRYRGSAFGILWSFFNPILMLVIYSFVFSVVFKARWSGGSGSKSEFALVLFAGLIVFNFFAECFNKAPGLVLANANYVKKVIFPLEILAWVNVFSAMFHALVGIAVWVVFRILAVGPPPFTVLLFPMALLPIGLMILGVSWFLSSLGVFLRDIAQLTAVATTVLMFLSPIFFPIEALPEQYRAFLALNPLAPAIEQMRDILHWGTVPDPRGYLLYLIASIAVALLGFGWFQKTRKGFADVI